MATKKSNSAKAAYKDRLIGLIDDHKSVIIMTIENISSNHLQRFRKQIRGRAEMLFGKNTYIRKVLSDYSNEKPSIIPLIDRIKGNCGMIFTNESLKGMCTEIKENKVSAFAKAGLIAPNDVCIAMGPTHLPPDLTNFFQTLNIPTKIVRGQIDIASNIDLIKTGDKVGGSEVELLAKLKIKPFLFGPKIDSVFDDGVVFTPEILEMDEQKILGLLGDAANVLSAIGLASGVPNTASIAHSLRHSMKTLLSVAIETDYPLKEAEELKERIANPEKFACAAPVEAKKEEVVEEEEEKEESEDEGGIGGIFGGSDDSDSD